VPFTALELDARLLEGIRDLLSGVGAMIVEVHELKPGHRVLGPLFDLLDRAGYVTAVRSFTPASWRQSSPPDGPFKGAIVPFLVTLQAWRS